MNNTGKYLDLHCHLDGSITPEIAKKLAELQGIKLPTENDEELEKTIRVAPDCQSLTEFLKCFGIPCSLMQTKEGLEEGTYLVLENMRATGTAYAEIRFAPQFHRRNGLTQEEAIQSVLAGMEKSELKANLILCCIRGGNTAEGNPETLEIAKKYLVKDGGVVALDLAGDEANSPAENYIELFAKARDYNIPLSIHAGEAAGAESVRKAIELGACRIGHGVRINEDESVMKLVRDKGIFLEMCPSSNRITRACADMTKYPLLDYLNYGIKVTLNTDDLAIIGTDIAGEFDYMRKLLGMTADQERQIIENSIEAAFTTDEVKEGLRAGFAQK